MVAHVGRIVMQLPVASDRQMIGQDLFADEDEAVFAEMAVGARRSRHIRSDNDRPRAAPGKAASAAASSIFSKSSPPCVPAGRASSGKANSNCASQRRVRDIVARSQAQDVGNAAAGNAGQQLGTASRVVRPILRGIVDDGLAEPRGKLRPPSAARLPAWSASEIKLTTTSKSPSAADDPARSVEQRQRVGVVGRILEQIFGRRVAGERRVEREHAEIRRRLDRAPPDQRLDLRRRGIGRLGGVEVAEFLMDARRSSTGFRRRCGLSAVAWRKCAERGLDLVQLEADPAELLLDLAVLRPLLGQLRSAATWRPPSVRSRSAPAPDWCATANALGSASAPADRARSRPRALPVCMLMLPRLHQQAVRCRREPQRGLVVVGRPDRAARQHQALPSLACNSAVSSGPAPSAAAEFSPLQ